MKQKLILLISVLVAAATTLSSAASYASEAQAVDELIEAFRKKAQITGLAAAVVYEGEIITARGFGKADIANNIAVSPDTRFQIGSTSKLFTALAVMKLVETGKIQLDKDIRTYLPKFNPKVLSSDAKTVTVRDLLTHHSGIPSVFLRQFVMNEPDPELFMQTTEWLSETYLTWPHQQVFAYCNVCFSLMGELVATVSKQSYADFVEQHIFEPLGMDDSLVFGIPGETAKSSRGFTAGAPTDPLLIKDIPAGGYMLTANNMAKFIQALVFTHLGYSPNNWLKSSTLNSMLKQQFAGLPMNDDFQIGLGFWLDEHNGQKQVGHGGTVPPFYSELKVLPDWGMAVFIASNDNMGPNIVLDELAGDIFDLLLPFQTSTKTAAVNAGTIKDGNYNLGGLGLVSILTTNNQRQVEVPGFGRFDLNEIDSGLVAADLGLELHPFTGSAAGTPLPVAFFGYLTGYLLGPATLVETQSALQQYQPWLGDYESDDLIETAKLFYDQVLQTYRFDIKLRPVLGDQLAVTVKPIGEKLMQVQGYGRNVGNVIQLDVQNGKRILRYSGITFRSTAKVAKQAAELEVQLGRSFVLHN